MIPSFPTRRLTLCCLFAVAACGADQAPTAADPAPAVATATKAAPTIRTVDLATFRNDFYAGKVPFLLDVRTAGEYAGGHVRGAVNIPLDQVETRADELATHKEAEIYVICESGGRSARAAALLAERGYRTVNVQGGTYAWRSDGQPVE